MQVPVPAVVSDLVIRVRPELWAPDQIVHRLRSGALDDPLVLADPRWRGTLELSPWAAFGDAAGDVDRVAAVDLFLARMSRPDRWCEMPWGGDAPSHRIPDAAYRAAVTVAETEAAGFSVQRSAGAGGLREGDWVRSGGRAAMVDAAGAVGGAGQAGLRTLPALSLAVGAVVEAGTVMRMRFTPDGDATLALPRTAGLGGPWVLPWEEYLG